MADAYHHAVSSARTFGGTWEDYYPIHEFMDHTKDFLGDARHRVILHNTWGISIAQRIFGEVLTRPSDGKCVPVRQIAEQHIMEDLGFLPTLERCLNGMQNANTPMPLEAWMYRRSRPLSREQARPVVEVVANEEG